MVFQEEKGQIRISTHMNSGEEGYVLIDTIVALFILAITLTSVYGLLTKSLNLEISLVNDMDEIISAGEEYDKAFESFIK